MQTEWVVKCRICGALFKIYAFAVYPGDPSCCSKCNRKAEGSPDPGKASWVQNAVSQYYRN